MDFDLNTAIAVREREDGLLEKDTFDFSSAVPIPDNDTGILEKVMTNPKVSKMIDVVTGGLSQEEANRFTESIVSPLAKIGEILVEDKSAMPTPEKVGKATIELGKFVLSAIGRPISAVQSGLSAAIDKRPGAEIIQSMFKGYMKPEEVESITSKIPFQEWEQGAWTTLIPRATAEAIETYAISTLVYGNIAGKIKNAYNEAKSAGALQELDDITTKMAKEIVKDPKKFKMNFPEEWNEADRFGMTKAYLQNRLGSVPKVGTTLMERQSFMSKLKTILKSERGSLEIPRVGDTISWKGQVGKIKEITGERVIIALGNSEIVATLSQLSLPEAPKVPEIKPKEAQGEAITPKAISDLPLAIRLKSGEIISDATAKLHSDIITNKGINPDEVEDVGVLNKEGQYEGTHTLQGKPLETLPEVPEEVMSKVRGIVEEPKKESVINLKNLNISEEAKTNIENISAEIAPELEKVKGETLTHSEVLDAAKSSEILTKLIDREQSKEVEAALLRTRQHLSALAEGKGVSEEFIKTLKIVKSFGTDTARKLGSLGIKAGSNEYNLKTKLVNDLTERGVEIDKIIKAAEDIDFNNQEQVTGFYRQFVKPKFWDLINEYRYINLLSSPKTHIVNAFSNLIQVSGLAPATKVLSGDIKGAGDYIQGAVGSIGDAATKALEALKGKVFIERPDIPRLPTGSKVLKPFRYIPQALEACDVFFRTIAYEGELASQLAKGVSRGEAEELAKDKAAYFVFRKALDPKNKTGQGNLLSAIDNLTSMIYRARNIPVFGRAVSWYIPFIQTPMNIAKQMIEYSPTGFSTLKGAKNKPEQLAKAFIGSLVFALSAYLVYKNDSAWSVPTSKKEKDLFFAAGRQPFSIKIGNTWVGYSRLGPLALPIAIPAAIKHYTQENPNSVTDTALQKSSKVIGGLGEFFASMSYVEGIGQLMGLVKNAPGALSKLAAEAPSQLILLSSLQRWINNFFIDPIYRKTDKEISAEAIIDNARKSIIFTTKGLPAYENPEGEISRRSYPGLNAFSPIPLSKSNKEYEAEYKDYIIERKENLQDKKDQEDRPSRRRR